MASRVWCLQWNVYAITKQSQQQITVFCLECYLVFADLHARVATKPIGLRDSEHNSLLRFETSCGGGSGAVAFRGLQCHLQRHCVYLTAGTKNTCDVSITVHLHDAIDST
ncbi:hypothetical protein ECG_07671 [Echinococcus granulosus]|nr:hypothetical protein ECG_07671 [Echinococcus granulosus]